MNKNIVISIIISLLIIASTFYLLSTKSDGISMDPIENVTVIDGIQYVTINVRGGYSPKISTVKAGMPVKLIMKTNNTYDCSASLSLPSLGIRKMLQSTGEDVIDLGSLESGKTISGTCSMGMYNFKIKVE